MPRLLSLLALFLVLASPVCSAPTASDTTSLRESMASIITGVKDSLVDVAETIKSAQEMQAEITRLEGLNLSSANVLKETSARLDAHTARVQQLGDRYTKVLEIAQRLKKDLELSVTWNYILGGTAAAAILVAVGVGLAR